VVLVVVVIPEEAPAALAYMMMVVQILSPASVAAAVVVELFQEILLMLLVVGEEFNGVHQDLEVVDLVVHKEILVDQVPHCSSHQTQQEAVAAAGVAIAALLEMVAALVEMDLIATLFGHQVVLVRLVLQEVLVTSPEVEEVVMLETTLADLGDLVAGVAAAKAVKQMAARPPTEMQQLQDLEVAAEETITVLERLAEFTFDTQHLEVKHGIPN